jgi:hypothetical protein
MPLRVLTCVPSGGGPHAVRIITRLPSDIGSGMCESRRYGALNRTGDALNCGIALTRSAYRPKIDVGLLRV